MARSFRCKFCKQPGRAAERGPLPEYHPRCRELAKAQRRAKRAVQGSRRLQSVPEPAPVPPEPVADDLGLLDDEPGEREALADVVRRELADVTTAHPATETLAGLAGVLAGVADALADGHDPRALAAISRELRETVTALVNYESEGDDDLFGDMSAPVVVTPTG